MRAYRRALVAVGLIAAATAVGPGPARSQETETRPNILLIVTDDQRADGTLDVMPSTQRAFIKNGTYFYRAVATTPVCCPSRASIFSGRYAHNHDVRSNAGGEAQNLDQETTVQYYLNEIGYRTGMIGKYLNEWDLGTPPPYFDEYAITHGGYSKKLFMTGAGGSVRFRKAPGYSTNFIEQQAVRFLKRGEAVDEAPWFLVVTPFAPHMPAVPSGRYRHAKVPRFDPNPAMLELDLGDKPPQYLGYAEPFDLAKQRDRRNRQLRTLMDVDDMVARLMRVLDANGEGDTLAVFTSDNGYMWGDHGLTAKAAPYTPSMGVPLMIRWPGRVTPGVLDDRMAANIDIAPTLLEAAGVAPRHEVDGRSLLTDWDRTEILGEAYGALSRPELRWASLRTNEYQYVEYYGSDDTVPTFREYYDLVDDPWQLNNLLADGDPTNDPDVAELSVRLAADRACPLVRPCP